MDLFEIAQENFLISFAIIIGIGVLQGGILGRGIRKRFPSLKIHARVVSIILLILFLINASANIIKFAMPEKFSLSEFTVPVTAEEGFSFLINFLGLNAGFGTAVAIFVSVTIVLFFKFAEIHYVARYFIFTLSVITIFVAGVSRFTEFIPTIFQILVYAFYQLGITLGIFIVTRRKETDVLSELE